MYSEFQYDSKWTVGEDMTNQLASLQPGLYYVIYSRVGAWLPSKY